MIIVYQDKYLAPSYIITGMLPEYPRELHKDLYRPFAEKWDLEDPNLTFHLESIYNLMRSLNEQYGLSFMPVPLVPPAERALLPILNAHCPSALYIRYTDVPTGLHFAPEITNPITAGIPLIYRVPHGSEYGDGVQTLDNIHIVTTYPAALDLLANIYTPQSGINLESYHLEGLSAAAFFRGYGYIANVFNPMSSEMLLDPTDVIIQEHLAELFKTDVYRLKTEVLAHKKLLLPTGKLISFAPDGEPITINGSFHYKSWDE